MAHTLAGLRFTELALLTLRLNGDLMRAADRLVEDLGLTGARWQVLAAIREESTTVARLARRMGLTRQSVQRTADRLVEDGFAECAPNPHHRSSPLLRLTGDGAAVIIEARRRQTRWANRVVEDLGTTDLAAACRILSVISHRLSPAAGERSADPESFRSSPQP